MTGIRTTVVAVVAVSLSAWLAPEAKAIAWNEQMFMSKGVYVNGEVHFFSFNTGSDSDPNRRIVNHRAGPVSSSTWAWEAASAENSPDLGVCVPGAGSLPGWGIDTNMNAAVFGEKLFLAFAGWKGCNRANGANLFVLSYDLPTKTFGAVVDLGPVKHKGIADSQGRYAKDAATAAIAVFGDLLYVFSDAGTHTSGDGVNWAPYSGFPAGIPVDGEPLDAIAFYPPDDEPRLLVVYGSVQSTKFYNWSVLTAVSWNGKFDATSDARVVTPFMTDPQGTVDVVNVNLFAGTATPANAPGFIAGVRGPAVQALVLGSELVGGRPTLRLKRFEFTYDSAATEKWTTDPGKFGSDVTGTYFVWYTDDECQGDSRILRQHLIGQYPTDAKGGKVSVRFLSDAMVPRNRSNPISCATWGGEITDTDPASTDPETVAALRKYWTLIGVVMGSPPFAWNEATDWEIPELSNVKYGGSVSTGVTHTEERENTALQSSSGKIRIGLKRFGLTPQFEQSYKHAWKSTSEDTSTIKTSLEQVLGTKHADTTAPEDLGRFGWAIFNIPNYAVQDFALYAYDYDPATGTGTPLGQDLHSIVVTGQPAVKGLAFELVNPGGPNDDVPGLMSGIGPFHRSTDLESGWKEGFSNAASNYTIVWGDGVHGEKNINPIYMGQNSGSAVTISRDDETVETKGETDEVEVKAGLGFDMKTRLKGAGSVLTLKGEMELLAGYSGKFTSSVTTKTATGKEVSAELGIPTCGAPDCLKTLTVQPFWLKATDASAPWIPPGSGQLPWVLTWQVKGGTYMDGRQVGAGLLPESAAGRVVGGSGGDAALSADTSRAPGAPSTGGSSGYALAGGKMIWEGSDGRLVPIPIAAGKFVPALGASVKVNGYTWASWLHDGSWTRDGKVWTFKTRKSVTSDVVTLKLDFGQLTWDFDLTRADLSPHLAASEGLAHVELDVNSKYRFSVDVEHDVQSQWDLQLPATAEDPLSLWLRRYRGSYDPSSGAGTVILEGDLADGLRHFGDMTFGVNGRHVDAPLRLHDSLEAALAAGQEIVYEREGLKVTVNFGTKKWSAEISKSLFDLRHLPRRGEARFEVKVGGQPWYSRAHRIVNYTSRISFQKWTHQLLGADGTPLAARR
jgi:hypothetical protein